MILYPSDNIFFFFNLSRTCLIAWLWTSIHKQINFLYSFKKNKKGTGKKLSWTTYTVIQYIFILFHMTMRKFIFLSKITLWRWGIITYLLFSLKGIIKNGARSSKNWINQTTIHLQIRFNYRIFNRCML